MGIKNQHMMAQRAKLREIELAKKANMWVYFPNHTDWLPSQATKSKESHTLIGTLSIKR